MKLPKVGELVSIAWRDTASNDAWSGDPKTPTVIECVTVGFVISSSRKQVRVSGSYARDAAFKYGERVAIPTGCIRSIRRLRVGKLISAGAQR